MRVTVFALVVASICIAGSAEATRRHHPALRGTIGETQQPVQPVVGQMMAPPSSAGGSLVSHGAFLYALIGDKVYKLDPKNLRILSVQRLGGRVTAATTALPAKKRTRRHPVIQED